MSVVNFKMLIYINMCCILTDDRKIANEVWFIASISSDKLYGILWMPQNIVTENAKTAQVWNLWEKLIEDTSIWQVKNNNIIVVLYTMELFFSFFRKNLINRNENNIDI